jgi:hypothetical protein
MAQAPAVKKMVAKRPRAKEGGGREEENRPEISSSQAGRLRNTKLADFDTRSPRLETPMAQPSSIELRAWNRAVQRGMTMSEMSDMAWLELISLKYNSIVFTVQRAAVPPAT